MAQSLPILQPKLVVGLRTNIQGNVHFISDEEILYPAGSLLVLHNINQKSQKYIKLADKGENLTGVVVSPNKRFIGVVESGVKPTVTLYDTTTYKRKRQVTPPEDVTSSRIFAVVSFTQESKSIICITGEPDWMMYVFKTERNKLESSARANNTNGTGTVLEIVVSPFDPNQLILVGENLLRMLQCIDLQWRQYGYNKAEQTVLTSACWLSQDTVLVGTKDGKLLFLESGDLKGVYQVSDLSVLNLKSQMDPQLHVDSMLAITVKSSDDESVRCLISTNRGFAFTFSSGYVHLFEKETVMKYPKRSVFKIPDHTIFRENDISESAEPMTTIKCMNINPTQDRLIVTCNETQIYSVRLWSPDANPKEDVMFTEYGYVTHNGPVGSMSLCAWKPIMLTAGLRDRTLKVWNYEDCEMELSQTFQDDLFGVALHPTGLYCIVGFSDKLRFFTIMINEFVPNREFSVRICDQCCFSSLGHLFGAANGNIIQIYSTITFELLYTLKGHNGRITGLDWNSDDTKLISCGTDGAVYEWRVTALRRIGETIIKTCPFYDCAVTSDGKSTMAVGLDGYVRELLNSAVLRETQLATWPLDRVVLSNLDTMLFVADSKGVIYSIRLPLTEKSEYVEFTVHTQSINNMLITVNDRYIMSSSLDCTLCIWRVLNTEGKAFKMDKDVTVSREILIQRDVLSDKLQQIKDLTLRMHELDTEFAFQTHQNNLAYDNKIKDVHQGYCLAIEELKERNEQLEYDHQQELHNINQEINKIKRMHEQKMLEQEDVYNRKLINEYEKYAKRGQLMDNMRLEYEKKLETSRRSRTESEAQITDDFTRQLQEKDEQYEELIEQMKSQVEQHEFIKTQIEDDADREILELRATHEKQLKEEQDLNVRIRGETVMMRKKLNHSEKEIEDLKHNVYLLESDHAKFKTVIVDREKDLADLRKEIAERDRTIQDKEKRIHELKQKNQELEKFKFILDFKIKELESQIEPKERTIREQLEQINELVRELENLQKIILSLDMQLAESKEKLTATDKEVRTEVDKNRQMQEALKNLRNDIHQASGYIQDTPMLIRTLKNIFHKYNADKDFATAREEVKEARHEFLRQREFLERTVATLKENVLKNQSSVGLDKYRLVEENATLLMETNKLRHDLKHEQIQNKKLQSVLGFSKRYILPSVAQQKLQEAIATRQEIRDEYQSQIDTKQKELTVLTGENKRLTKIVTEEMRLLLQEEKRPLTFEERMRMDNKLPVRELKKSLCAELREVNKRFLSKQPPPKIIENNEPPQKTDDEQPSPTDVGALLQGMLGDQLQQMLDHDLLQPNKEK